jgi:hypothetical protein
LSATEKVINKVIENIAKQIGKQLGIPPQLIGRAPGVFGGIGLLLTPSELGCGSFDCDNDGIPDVLEQGAEDGESSDVCK